jgi:hypothetical protein
VELIVQPDAKDAVGEVGRARDADQTSETGRSRTGIDASSVDRAKVHVKALYFPSPSGSYQLALRAVAHHPTGINLRMGEGLGKREAGGDGGGYPADCVRSVYTYSAVSQSPGRSKRRSGPEADSRNAMVGTKRKTARRRSFRNRRSGGCERSSVLPLPAPAKQTQRAEAGGEEWECGR